MTSLLFEEKSQCRWCFAETATTILYGVPTGLRCAAGKPKDRVSNWLSYVRGRMQERKQVNP